MTLILLYAILGAVLVSFFLSLRYAWADYLGVPLLFFDAVVLFLTNRVAAGIVLLLAGCGWLTVRLRYDRRTGGAR